jgi:hypothetical protein
MSTQNINDGGPAFPCEGGHSSGLYPAPGMTLRDYFAANCQADDRLVKCIRAMDDKSLEFFALYPDSERDEHITAVEYTDWSSLPSEVAKVKKRLELEANAIAKVRYMQADAMLKAREGK